MIKIRMEGFDVLRASLEGKAKQVRQAAAGALNDVAFEINAAIKREMQAKFQGGASPYALRAFKVTKAKPDTLTAVVALREDGPSGGTSYQKSLRHLFTSGTRDWKKMEGLLRGRNLMPDGYMAVPGAYCPLDSRGNIVRTSFAEMLGVLRSTVRNLRVGYRGTNRGKVAKMVGYFVIMPGARSHLQPGIYRRIEQASYGSVAHPYLMFVRKGRWKRLIDLAQIGTTVVGEKWERQFSRWMSFKAGAR